MVIHSLFSSFFNKTPEQINRKNFLTALKICQQAIKSCEEKIISEIQEMAKARNTISGPVSSIQFSELHFFYFNQSYHLANSIVELYQKRDIFLDLQAQLLGDQPEIYQGSLPLNQGSLTPNDKIYKIGELSQKSNISINNTDDAMKMAAQCYYRASEDIVSLKQKAASLVKAKKMPDNINIPDRLQKAKEFLTPEKIAVLNTFRDTSNTDGFLLGLVRKLGRLLASITKAAPQSAKQVDELQSCFTKN